MSGISQVLIVGSAALLGKADRGRVRSEAAGNHLAGLRSGELSEHLDQLSEVSFVDTFSNLKNLSNLTLALGLELINAHTLALSAGHAHEDREVVLLKKAS